MTTPFYFHSCAIVELLITIIFHEVKATLSSLMIPSIKHFNQTPVLSDKTNRIPSPLTPTNQKKS